jgi:hypothetical protein
MTGQLWHLNPTHSCRPTRTHKHTFAGLSSARASARSCFWPADSGDPPSPSTKSSPPRPSDAQSSTTGARCARRSADQSAESVWPPKGARFSRMLPVKSTGTCGCGRWGGASVGWRRAGQRLESTAMCHTVTLSTHQHHTCGMSAIAALNCLRPRRRVLRPSMAISPDSISVSLNKQPMRLRPGSGVEWGVQRRGRGTAAGGVTSQWCDTVVWCDRRHDIVPCPPLQLTCSCRHQCARPRRP